MEGIQGLLMMQGIQGLLMQGIQGMLIQGIPIAREALPMYARSAIEEGSSRNTFTMRPAYIGTVRQQ